MRASKPTASSTSAAPGRSCAPANAHRPPGQPARGARHRLGRGVALGGPARQRAPSRASRCSSCSTCSGVAPFWGANVARRAARPAERVADVAGDRQLHAAQARPQLVRSARVFDEARAERLQRAAAAVGGRAAAAPSRSPRARRPRAPPRSARRCRGWSRRRGSRSPRREPPQPRGLRHLDDRRACRRRPGRRPRSRAARAGPTPARHDAPAERIAPAPPSCPRRRRRPAAARPRSTPPASRPRPIAAAAS